MRGLPELVGSTSRAFYSEKTSAMPISPQFVVALFLFIANTFPDHPSSTSIDIAELVTRAKNGDSNAVTLLYQIHSQRIFRYVVTRVPTVADAEDLTAEVFVRMVKGLPTYAISGAPFEAWLYRIASSRVTDFYRFASKHPSAELDESWSDNAPLPEEQILHDQALDQLRTALQNLPEEHQIVLILRFVERKSHDEVAQIIGKSVQAVKSIQHRALIRLTELMGSGQKARHYLRGSHE